MNKILITLFAVLAIFAFGCVSNEKTPPSPQTGPNFSNQSAPIQTSPNITVSPPPPQEIQPDQIFQAAYEGKYYCDKAADTSRKSLCVALYAAALKDEAQCYGKINLADYGLSYDATLSACLAAVAVQKSDGTLCEKSSYATVGCFDNLAYKTNNLEYCRSDNCKATMAYRASNEDMCAGLTTTNFVKEDCLTALGFKKKSPQICSTIQDSLWKSICEFTAMGDISVCDSQSSELYKDYCYAAVSKSINDISVCNRMKGGEMKDINCITYLAKKNKDYGTCENIQTDAYRKKCILDVAQINVDTDKCNELDGNMQLLCLSGTWLQKIGMRTTGFNFASDGEYVAKTG